MNTLHIERFDDVALVTVDRPHRRNALDPPTLLGLAGALATPRARVVIITAAGTESFGSGMDLHALRADRAAAAQGVAALRDIFSSPNRVPVIAAVNGPATAGGFEIVLRCDLAVAADHATFALPEVRRGLLAGGGGTLLPCRIPIAIALELGLTGEPIDAARAYELGLINRIVPATDLLDVALGLARTIAANAPIAVRAMRRAMWASLDGAQAAWAATETGQREVSASNDMIEGLAAFAEKRPPRWTGT